MGSNCQLLTGIQTFEDVIKLGGIYVDKTAYLAKMIEDTPSTWFLARPRRFGKSLIVSTFKSIFLGQKGLFKGLAIEKKLDDERFAPRPVLHLDMSKVIVSEGVGNFKSSLVDKTYELAELLKIYLPLYNSPVAVFSKLILRAAVKFENRVAILIDEYDAPVTDLLDKPDEAEQARVTLREFYRQLKAYDKYISFVFVTGITKFVQGGLYSAFNNPIDISLDPEFGSLAGFTQEEIAQCFPRQLDEVARRQQMPQQQLLERMKNYYDGFCFDNETLVYNPFSTLMFLQDKEFSNFWFNTASPDQLISFLNENRLTFEQFRGVQIDKDRIKNPGQSRNNDPESYLYQMGYLSLRPSQSNDMYTLDYPNLEVSGAMARRLMDSYFESPTGAEEVRENVRKALASGNPAALVGELNLYLSKMPFDYSATIKLGEFDYCLKIIALFYAMGLNFRAEEHGSQGRSGFAVECAGQSWVIEVKLGHEREKGEEYEKLANVALKQIHLKNYVGGYRNPVLLGLAINDNNRAISSWECEGVPIAKPQAKKTDTKEEEVIPESRIRP